MNECMYVSVYVHFMYQGMYFLCIFIDTRFPKKKTPN